MGVATGNWCPPPPDDGLFPDQREDEARSAVFQTEPLPEAARHVLGTPAGAVLHRHPGPRAMVAVKLKNIVAGR